MAAVRDEARNTKPVRIPSLPPPTAPQPVIARVDLEHDRDGARDPDDTL